MSFSQTSTTTAETPFPHMNKLRYRDQSLDVQVVEFLSAARQKPFAEDLVRRLYKGLKAKEVELAEATGKLKELTKSHNTWVSICIFLEYSV